MLQMIHSRSESYRQGDRKKDQRYQDVRHHRYARFIAHVPFTEEAAHERPDYLHGKRSVRADSYTIIEAQQGRDE